MVKANVDMIVDYLRTKKSVSLPEISKFLSLPKEDVQKSIEYLEEDGIIKIDYRLTTPFAILIKDPNTMVIPPSPSFDQPQKVRQQEQQQIQQTQQTQQTQQIQRVEQMQQQPAQQFSQQQPPLQTSFIDLNRKKEEAQFLFNNTQEEHTILTPDPNKNLNATLTFMQQPDNFDSLKEEKFDFNPLEPEKPKFDLNPPSPVSARETKEEKPFIKSALSYGEEYKEDKEMTIFPSYIESTIEKIDFMVDFANKKIVNHEYKDLNVLYRKIYNFLKEGEDLSPNERYLAGEKINELFQRIRRIYLIEGVVI